MELGDVIKVRRSIRRFKPDPVPDEFITELLEAARLAPSVSNLQSSRYVVIKSAEVKKQLGTCTLPFVTTAPAILVCCTDSEVWSTGPGRWAELREAGAFDENPLDVEKIIEFKKRGPFDAVVAKNHLWLNAAIALEHITLRAVELGLGSCWITIVDRIKAKEILKLEDRYDVVALLPIGYPDQNPAPRPRLALNDIVLKEL